MGEDQPIDNILGDVIIGLYSNRPISEAVNKAMFSLSRGTVLIQEHLDNRNSKQDI